MTSDYEKKLDKEFLRFYMGLVGLVLTGRKVSVQFRQPYLKNTRGMAFRDGKSAILQIKPGMGEEQTLRTYLHELAHVKHHFVFLPSFGVNRKPASYRWTNKKGFYERYGGREEQAREFSDAWFNYAVKHGGESLRSRLLSLVGVAFRV